MQQRFMRLTEPIVLQGIWEMSMGAAPAHTIRMAALAGMLVGMGNSPREALTHVSRWENRGMLPLAFTDPTSVPGVLADLPGMVMAWPGIRMAGYSGPEVWQIPLQVHA